jgi:hypothetical protein
MATPAARVELDQPPNLRSSRRNVTARKAPEFGAFFLRETDDKADDTRQRVPQAPLVQALPDPYRLAFIESLVRFDHGCHGLRLRKNFRRHDGPVSY